MDHTSGGVEPMVLWKARTSRARISMTVPNNRASMVNASTAGLKFLFAIVTMDGLEENVMSKQTIVKLTHV
jgi:hypothetical protein